MLNLYSRFDIDCNKLTIWQNFKKRNKYQRINNLRDLKGHENDEDLNDNLNYEVLYTMWATDLLPNEFHYNKVDDIIQNCEKKIKYVGSIGAGNSKDLIKFAEECKNNGIQFLFSDPWKNPLSFDLNLKSSQESIISPDIRGSGDPNKLNENGTHHKYIGYIPCRIFKNISYGCLGITNSKYVYELLDKLVIYDDDESKLLYLGLKERVNKELILKQMDLVKEKHTYINRANDIINIVNRKL